MSMELSIWSISDIKPYEKNAKLHTPEQIEKIAASISNFGWDQPIVIDKDGVIIKGHGRRLAAMRLGISEVPVLVRGDLTKEQVKAARIADNQVALGGFDSDLLKADLAELFAAPVDFSLTDMGFDEGEIDLETLTSDESDLLGALEQVSSEKENSPENAGQSATSTPKVNEVSYERKFEVAVECESEADQEAIYEMLSEKGYKCRIMSM